MDTQPGQVFNPREDGTEQPGSVPQQPAQPAQPAQPNPPQPAMPPVEPSGYTPAGSAMADTDWQYSQEADPGASQFSPLPADVTWNAAEFIEHQKGAGWYGLVLLAGIALAALDLFLFRDIISTVIIVFVTILFTVYAGHKPRTQQYRLSPQGLQIGEKLYGFQGFKNFSVAEEGPHISVVFMPLQRFMPLLTVYLTPDIENQVVDYLSNFLPLEQHRVDAIDGLLRRIKF